MSDVLRRPSRPLDDETAFIEWIRQQAGISGDVPIGIGDDCAGLRLPAGDVTLVTTDMLIAGVHFRPEEVGPRQVGHKAVARGLSDIAAMAGEAVAVVVALAAPRDISVDYLQEVFFGMKAAADATDVRIVGGDISTGDLPLMLTVTAIGAGKEGAIPLRSGARVGDMLLLTGELGGALLGKHLTFLPRLKEAIWLREAVSLHAMIDISDGLSVDAAHIAEESGVAVELWEDVVPVSAAAQKMAERTGKAPLEHALHDGEDYELLFTASAKEAETLLQRPDLPVRTTCIGEVAAGSGIWIGKRGGERRRLERGGWVHRF